MSYTPGQERLMDAFVRLTESHQPSRSLEEIAREAGYTSKGTPGNHFRDRRHLVATAVRRELLLIHATIQDPSNDLREDLIRLARNYSRYLVSRPFLAFMLPEIASDEALRQELQEHLKRTTDRLIEFNDHHRQAGSWSAWVQEGSRDDTLGRVSLPFLGPIFAQVVWSRLGIVTQEFDPVAHTDAFLGGYGRDATQEQLVAKRLISTLCRDAGLDPPE